MGWSDGETGTMKAGVWGMKYRRQMAVNGGQRQRKVRGRLQQLIKRVKHAGARQTATETQQASTNVPVDKCDTKSAKFKELVSH